MATADSQSQPGATACAASEPIAVYRYSLRQRLLVVVVPIPVTFGILWRPVFDPEPGWRFTPPGVVEVGLLVGLCIASCFLIVQQFSRFELWRGKLVCLKPFGLPPSAVRFEAAFHVEERQLPWWRSLNMPWELQITGTSDRIVVTNSLPGYWDLRRRLKTIQAEKDSLQDARAESA